MAREVNKRVGPDLPTERLNRDMADDVNPDDLDSLTFELSKYQQFSADAATVVLAYRNGVLPVVVWNLEPGQENDFHMHPDGEHLHIVLEGEVEYSLGDRPARTVTVGQAVMVPKGVPHGIRNVSDQRASYIAITSPGAYEKIPVERGATT